MTLAIICAALAAAGVFYFLWRLSRMALPPATTFKEGQRALALWLLSGGGVFCGTAAAAIAFVMVYGPWSTESEGQRLTILGWSLGGFQIGVVLVIAALMIGGPVGRFKGSVSKDGASGEFDRGEDEE